MAGKHAWKNPRVELLLYSRILLLTIVVLLSAGKANPQSLELKLSQEPDYIPLATSSRDQLIELARHYKIAMGIEWVQRLDEKPKALTAKPTVLAMMQSILEGVTNYTIEIRDGVVWVGNPTFSADSQNFLNLTLPEYNISKTNVFGAEAALRHKIRRILHPELYAGGSNDGYGYGVPRDDTFDLNNISISEKNITVRTILNRIAAANGNALWIVDIIPSKRMKNEPFFGQPCQSDFCWQIIPLIQ